MNNKDNSRIPLSPISLNPKTTNKLKNTNTNDIKSSKIKSPLNNDGYVIQDISYADRLIPRRPTDNNDYVFLVNKKAENSLKKSSNCSDEEIETKDDLKSNLKQSFSCENVNNEKILSFEPIVPFNQKANNLGNFKFESLTTKVPKWKSKRRIPTAAERILDAPNLQNDYYLNLLDWSPSNQIAIGLGSLVYVWDASSCSVNEFRSNVADENSHVTSVKWCNSTTNAYIAIGMSNGDLEIWDENTSSRLRTIRNGYGRVPSLSWNSYLLSCGSRSGVIFNIDVRTDDSSLFLFEGHSLEVCGLSWAPDGRYIASGGNDNQVNIWNLFTSLNNSTNRENHYSPLNTYTSHTGAVKALAWSSRDSNLLATGGGSHDRTIRLWNVQRNIQIRSTQAQSQVNGLVWCPHYDEIISAHGYSQNNLCIWRYPNLSPITSLTGHTDRILSISLSPDGTYVASISADETLRIWHCFDIDTPQPIINQNNIKDLRFR